MVFVKNYMPALFKPSQVWMDRLAGAAQERVDGESLEAIV